MGNLYNLVLTHLTFMVWLTNLLTIFKSGVPTCTQLEVSCMEYFSDLLLELQNNLDYSDSEKERDYTKCILLSIFPE